jgi:hypothetical protein
VLGLGFIPNQHKKKKRKQKDQATIRSDAGEAQKGPGRCRLADADSVTGARVEARTEILKKRRRRSKARSKYVAGSMTPHGDAKTSSWRSPPAHRQRSNGEEKEDMRCELGSERESWLGLP